MKTVRQRTTRNTLLVEAVLATAVLALLDGAVLAQTVLAQLGWTEAAARGLVMDEAKTSGGSRSEGKLPVAIMDAYQKIPVAARGPVTTALVGWIKAHVNSPAFATAYERIRTEEKPQTRQYARTIDEEMKQLLDENLAGLENARQAAASMSAADREKLLASLKDMEAKMRSPELQKAQRAALEADRAQGATGEGESVKRWQENFPADPQVLVARRLREFLDATADVDFAKRNRPVISLGGAMQGYWVDPAFNSEPWQWQHAFVAGNEATTAARAAAEAWLKEIGAK